MRDQPFEALLAGRGLPQGSLLRTVEHLVVESHAALHRDVLGEDWSPPRAYRWIRYEDPQPVARLLEASNALELEWSRAGATADARAEEAALDAAEAAARQLGYS